MQGSPGELRLAGLDRAPEPDAAELVVVLAELEGPWPANDDLFGLPRGGSGVLVVAASDERRASLLERMAQRGVQAEGAERLTIDGLEQAGTVVLAGRRSRDALEPGEDPPLPPLAPAVLAAGRVLIAPRSEPSHGLLPGVDHLAFVADDEAAQYADAVTSYPEAFELMRVMARVSAQAHRASAVYARMLAP